MICIRVFEPRVCGEHPGSSNNTRRARASVDPPTGRGSREHALIYSHALCAGGGCRCGPGAVPHREPMRSSTAMVQTHVRAGGSSTGVLSRACRGQSPVSAVTGPGSQGRGTPRVVTESVGTDFPPARYGYLCPQFAAPRTWWDSTTTTGSQSQFASPLYSPLREWGGVT